MIFYKRYKLIRYFVIFKIIGRFCQCFKGGFIKPSFDTLYREKIIRKLNAECEEIQKTINACIQINISSESTKSGCSPDELIDIAKLMKSMKNINLQGIMALPKLTENKIEREKMMDSILKCSLDLQDFFPEAKSISLGTTSDFEDAIMNGSTMVRIGESIFGKRV